MVLTNALASLPLTCQEGHKPDHRKSEKSRGASASKQTSSQPPVEGEKASRKHHHGSGKASKINSTGQKASSKSAGGTHFA